MLQQFLINCLLTDLRYTRTPFQPLHSHCSNPYSKTSPIWFQLALSRQSRSSFSSSPCRVSIQCIFRILFLLNHLLDPHPGISHPMLYFSSTDSSSPNHLMYLFAFFAFFHVLAYEHRCLPYHLILLVD